MRPTNVPATAPETMLIAVMIAAARSRVYAMRLDRDECAHRECPEPFDLHRHGREVPTTLGNVAEPAHVLHDRNVAPQQHRVHRPLPRRDTIDVQRVDP